MTVYEVNHSHCFEGAEADVFTCIVIFQSDKHLSKYLHIIRDSPVYPIIYDEKDHVLSMPPIINSEHSKITLNTRNVFVDVTATDETKLNIVVNIMATMFSEYCQEPSTYVVAIPGMYLRVDRRLQHRAREDCLSRWHGENHT